jgi:putative ABC transport system permease protein
VKVRAFLLVAGFLSMAVANAQFQLPKLPAKPAGYIVIDSIKPGIGRLVLALDADRDGSLSRAEIAKAPLALGGLDRDGNGRLDSSEIASRPAEISGQRSGFVNEYGLKRSECHDLKQMFSGIPKIITVRVTQEQAYYTDIEKGWLANNATVQLVGAEADLTEVQPLPLERGRFLEPRDDSHTMPVAVIGRDVARKLFPGGNPIGKIIKLGSLYYHVIGVLKEGGPRPMAVYIPEATMRSTYGYREVKRQSGGITARHFEISKAWIPVPNARLAEVMLRAISRGLDPKKERHDLHYKYIPAK